MALSTPQGTYSVTWADGVAGTQIYVAWEMIVAVTVDSVAFTLQLDCLGGHTYTTEAAADLPTALAYAKKIMGHISRRHGE